MESDANSLRGMRASSELEPELEAPRTAMDALASHDASNACGLDSIAGTSASLVGAAEEARREALRCRAVLDGLPDGVVETDAAGVMTRANQRLAGWLEVAPSFLAGRPLLHFVVRGDCRSFRDAIAAAAARGEVDGTIVRFRPRRGASIFAAELRARRVGLGPRASTVWTVRQLPPGPREQEPTSAAGSLQALIGSARQTIAAVATARRITVANARPTTLNVDPKRAGSLLGALVELAGVALRLAEEGATLSIDVQPLDGEEAVVAFGPASLRLPVCREASACGNAEAPAQPRSRTG